DKNVAKAAIISAVPPLMVKTPANPLGTPKSVFDDLQVQLAANRAKFYYDLPAGPFYGFNRPGVKTIEPIVWNWWRQGMMGGAKAHYDGIVMRLGTAHHALAVPRRITMASSRSRRPTSRRI